MVKVVMFQSGLGAVQLGYGRTAPSTKSVKTQSAQSMGSFQFTPLCCQVAHYTGVAVNRKPLKSQTPLIF